MSKTGDVAAYFCEHYPHKSELSKTRLTKLVYLADWEAAKKLGRQITGIDWYFHNFGPYVDDVMETVESDPRFEVVRSRNYYGENKLEIRATGKLPPENGLGSEEVKILDAIIAETSPMYWNSFIKHVYATDPIENSNRYQHLDLIAFGRDASQA